MFGVFLAKSAQAVEERGIGRVVVTQAAHHNHAPSERGSKEAAGMLWIS